VDERLASYAVTPVGFSGLKTKELSSSTRRQHKSGVWGAKMVGLRTKIRQWLGPFTLAPAAKRVSQLADQIRPQLIHAMRIPFEGMIAAMAKPSAPLLVSIWGNDFTLHAKANIWMGRLTRNTLHQVDALHSDCYRDLRLAQGWGFEAGKPGLVVPGAGGIQMDTFYPPDENLPDAQRQPLSVINPRGIRAYVRNDVFFRSIRLVAQQLPEVKFFCPAMADDPQAEKWVRELEIEANTCLLPKQSRLEMADLFRRACVVVSPSVHDGTPNTLLEAMACGCFPVAGDLESLREWIEPNENGLLVDPNDPSALAHAILEGLLNRDLQEKARLINHQIIAKRADYRVVMPKVRRFYEELIQ
jgi:glycosyltransferase involved in cell wall biosynthesis